MQPNLFRSSVVPFNVPSLMDAPVRKAPIVRGAAIRTAVDFLQSRIREEATLGDRAAALSLAGVLEVLHGLGRASDLLRRRAEAEAYDYIAGYTDFIAEAGAAMDVVQGFRLVADVIAATDVARKEESRTGQLCSYARVEEIYEAKYAPYRN